MHPTFHPTSKILYVGWNVGRIWDVWNFQKIQKEEKIMLDDVGWSLIAIKHFIQHFPKNQRKLQCCNYRFACGIHLRCFRPTFSKFSLREVEGAFSNIFYEFWMFIFYQSLCLAQIQWPISKIKQRFLISLFTVSYTHLTLPTICSV